MLPARTKKKPRGRHATRPQSCRPEPSSPPNGYGDGPEPKDASRDAKTGQFGPGNSVAAGHVNPTARARAELQKALVAAVTPADIDALAKKLLANALACHVPSAELLLKYVVGKPAPAVDPDRVAHDAWKLIQSWPMLAEFMAAVSHGLNPEAAAAAAALVIPGDGDGVIKRMGRALDTDETEGTAYVDKQNGAVIQRRLKKAK